MYPKSIYYLSINKSHFTLHILHYNLNIFRSTFAHCQPQLNFVCGICSEYSDNLHAAVECVGWKWRYL